MKESLYLLHDYYPNYSIDSTPVMVQYGEMLKKHADNAAQMHYHQHDYYEFFLIEEGDALHKINSKLFVVEKGTLGLIRPSDLHVLYPHCTERYKMYNVDYSKEEFDGINAFLGGQADILLESPYPRTVVLNEARLLYFTSAINRLRQMKPDAMRGAFAKSILASVLMELVTRDSRVAPLPTWMTELMHELSRPEVLCENTEQLFGRTGLSREYICRSFKKYFGMTPTQYVNEQRVFYAVDLLIKTDTSIIDVAQQSGFENLGYFHKNFRKYFNMTPGQCRKQYGKESASLSKS